MEDARLAVELGAWAVGFVFHASSPRAATPEQVGRITAELKVPGLKTAGVFVDASLDEVVAVVRRTRINTVQLHGDESPEFCRALKSRLGMVGLIKALRPRERAELARVSAYGESCEAVLIDSFVAGSPGGTGLQGDWELAAEAAQQARVVLAGGLRPENIADAIRVPGVHAWDVSSGLEEAPGIKSHEKMKSFFKNAQSKGAERD